MIKVLFVCLGNICRSPMAEAVFKHLIKKEGLEEYFIVDSAGIGAWHSGELPHRGTRKILDENHIPYEGIVARQIQKSDLQNFDYIIAMDDNNLKDLHQLGQNAKGVICKLLDFVPEIKDKNIPDPYYTGNFQEVYELVTKGCTNLLNTIKKEHQL